ncbi:MULTISPECIES: NAD-dependent epimerase/dehydratase family protein [Paraburkholderia]|uniref:NAD-dependent epimerase/dehydratase family protein n=1 Tax=Paraburkholderia TaxID=1822464 RepID=UPI0022565BC0|nr:MULTISPECIES: NAD-dependent epimerase/dehydratase family protein [Paraburkholderia]MCX4159978.1 GDP-mannose 4,6-dehydratase [Paraburkholderia megapolitana]MDN7155478.1 GDP-mannose 4,6-dehydratase [Paraburkholderia sp. CHISQ3]MDQ6492522.1 GDP-mannose 4,6-dehydratase [Paraburkholderia megapolitana]
MTFSSEPTPRRALITGARGFTGAYVRDELQRAGFEVVGTLAGNETPGLNEYVLDITSLDDCRRVIGEVRPTHIVHLAAISFVAHDDALEMYNVNVLGTLNLLQACVDVGVRPDKILIASSANVYGNAGGVIDESVVPAPVNHYAASKLAMEHLVRTWFERLPIVVTRPFNYTGRGQAPRFLVPKIVEHFVQRRPFIELGNLDVARDFSDVRTVAQTYRALLESAVAGEVVNVCSEHARTLHDVVDMVREASGHDLEIRVNPAFVRDNEVKLLVGSVARLRKLVPDVQPVDFAETIRWMVRPD